MCLDAALRLKVGGRTPGWLRDASSVALRFKGNDAADPPDDRAGACGCDKVLGLLAAGRLPRAAWWLAKIPWKGMEVVGMADPTLEEGGESAVRSTVVALAGETGGAGSGAWRRVSGSWRLSRKEKGG